MLLLHARLSFLLRAVLLLASVSCAFRPVAAALQGPPQNVTVGVCVTSSGAPFQLETSRALAYGIHLTNLDYTVIPATDILIQEVDCGDGTYEMARDATKDLFDTYPLVIGVIAGQSDEVIRGVSEMALNYSKPFLNVFPQSQVVSPTTPAEATYTIQLAAGEDAQAAAFIDLYAAYLNPTMKNLVPDMDRTRIRIIYSSDDAYSASLRTQIIESAAIAGVAIPAASQIDLPVVGASLATRATTAISTLTGLTGPNVIDVDDAVFVISSADVLPELLAAANAVNAQSRYLWVLSEQNVRAAAIATTIADPLGTHANGMLGLMRARGYLARDAMFGRSDFTELAGNTMNFAQFTLSEYGTAMFAYPDTPSLETLCAFDAIGTLARGLTTLLALASEGNVYLLGDLILANLLDVSYMGASGPKLFWSNGAAKNVRFEIMQVQTAAAAAGGMVVVGSWSPLTGASLIEFPTVRLNTALAGNSHVFLTDEGAIHERVTNAYSSVTPAYTYGSIPAMGSPPPPRYGGCVVVSKYLDALLVLTGTYSPTGQPYADAWAYSLSKQTWSELPVLGVKPSPRNYGSCIMSTDGLSVYLFGGLSSTGIAGDLWRFSVATSQWTQVPVVSTIVGEDLASRAQRAQFSQVLQTSAGKLSVLGGRHRPTVNTELWTFDTTTEKWTVAEVSYNNKPFLWAQPSIQVPFMSDLTLLPIVSSNTAAVSAATTIAGHEVFIIVGGYSLNTSVALLYDVATKTLAPLYCQGGNPGFRSLTRGVVVHDKLVVNHGWDENAGLNYDDVWTLDLNCPSPTCGTWEYALTWGDQRDSLPTVQYGDSQLITFGGWGAVAVHNDLVTFRTEPGQQLATTLHGDFNSPPARKYHSATSIGSNLVIYGGLGSDQIPTSDTYVLSFDTQTWEAQTSSTTVPSGRYGHSSSAIRLEAYVFGGRTATGAAVNDLLTYSVQTFAWTAFDPVALGIAPSNWPSSRYFHNSCSYQDRYIYIQGGLDDSGLVLRDIWRFDASKAVWELIAANPTDPSPADTGSDVEDSEFGAPLPASITRDNIRPLVACAGVLNGSTWYLIGGRDNGENPSSQMVSVDISTSPVQWTKLPSMPLARVGHAAALLSGRIYVSAGLAYEVAIDDLLAYNIATYTWTSIDLSRSWWRPRGQAGHSMSAYGNHLTIVGGSSTEFLNLHSPLFVLQETWTFRAGPACPVGNPNVVINGAPCSQCTPGTVASLRRCIPCAPGTYWTNDGQCSPCKAGFAGRLAGASSSALCIPCANGTYSDVEGSSACKPCDADKYCPIGSATGGLSYAAIGAQPDFEQRQPEPFASHANEVAAKTAELTYLLVAGLAFCGGLYLVYLAIPPLMEFMENVDVLYQFNHLQIPKKPMVRRQTPMGGLCTVVAVVLVVYLLVTLTLPYTDDNIIETRSLVPNVSVQQTIHVNIVATAKANGYQGQCVLPPIASGVPSKRCAPGIAVSLQETAHWTGALNASLACEQVADTTYRAGNGSLTGACLVTWTCPSCVGVVASEALTFSWLEENSFASSLEWGLKTSSGYPEQQSALSGTISTADDRFFRGTQRPTVVKVKMTPTLFLETSTQQVETGYHLNFDSRTPGADVAAESFYSSNGVLLQYQTELQLNTMSIVRSQKQTLIQFLGSLLGSISGVIAGVAVLMGIAETVEEVAFNKACGGRFTGKGTAGRLETIFQVNAEEVADQAHSKLKRVSLVDGGEGATDGGGASSPSSPAASPPKGSHVVKVHPASVADVEMAQTRPINGPASPSAAGEASPAAAQQNNFTGGQHATASPPPAAEGGRASAASTLRNRQMAPLPGVTRGDD